MGCIGRIAELDLSPIEIVEFSAGHAMLRFVLPVSFTPYLDPETGGFVVAERPELGIYVFAKSVPFLIEELRQQVAALWSGYALHPDEQLTPKAPELKRALLQAIQQVGP